MEICQQFLKLWKKIGLHFVDTVYCPLPFSSPPRRLCMLPWSVCDQYKWKCCQRSSMKFLGRVGCVTNNKWVNFGGIPRNTLLCYMRYHTNFGYFGSNRLAYSWIPKIWGTLGPHPLGIGAWLSPQKHVPLPRVFIPNFVALGQNWGSLGPQPSGWGRGWLVEICFSSPVLPCQIRSF